MGQCNEVEINGVKYIKAENLSEDYVIIRTYSAGVHAGYLVSRNGKEVELKNSRRIWYWDGAASLSQLAVDGPKKPDNCKFTVAVEKIILTEAIEIIPCTKSAKESIEGVKEWRQ